jgi:acyl-CoA reductase-like NAD-dependent aldehyde dehydrogenase
VGDPFDPEVQMGPLVSKQQLEKVASYLEQGERFRRC